MVSVVHVTPRRAREAKRKEAMLADKMQIASLEAQIGFLRAEDVRMRSEIQAWWAWYCHHRPHEQQQHRSHEQQQQHRLHEQQQQQPWHEQQHQRPPELGEWKSKGGIDYSKWEGLVCSSDEDDDEIDDDECGSNCCLDGEDEHSSDNDPEEEKKEGEPEEEEEAVEEEKTSAAEEIWCEEPVIKEGMVANDDGVEKEEEDAEKEEEKSKEEDPKRVDQVEETDTAYNKRKCIAMMVRNRDSVAVAFSKAKAAAAASDDHDRLLRTLQEAEARAAEQAQSYISMMSHLAEREFMDTGQLEGMIQLWEDDFQATIQRICAAP